MDELRAWAVVANAIIALSYLALAIWAVPRIKAKQPPGGYLGALIAMGVFFATCGATHVSLAVHIAAGDAEWMLQSHHLVNHTLQAFAAPVALLFAVLFLDVTIEQRTKAVVVKLEPKEGI